ncbi:MAG: hypothetical protein ACREKS_12590 [Candidatus Rokuibacteriota bacterium]
MLCPRCQAQNPTGMKFCDQCAAPPVEQLTIPATVQAIPAARIDRLAPEAKRLLQAAAGIGKDVPMPLLLAIADAPESELRAELTRLQAAEFLDETRLFPDLEYTFKHALTHEVAYGGLLHDRQRAQERSWRSPAGWGPGPARLTPSASLATSRRQAGLSRRRRAPERVSG